MTYDFNGAWDSITGMNSPLYPRADEYGLEFDGADRSTRNLDWAARYWVELGAPKEKLVLGIATFGRCFTLADAANNGLGAPVIGPCKNGTYTREAGFLAYYEICQVLNEGATRVWADEHKAPYAYKGDQWIGYDDEESLGIKVDYIMANGYSGWMVWNVDLDDFSGNLGCNAGTYPLISFANDRLDGATPAPTVAPTTTRSTAAPTAAPTTTTTTAAPTAAPTTTPGSTEPFTCVDKPNGNYVNPDDCTSFIVCSNEVETVMYCSQGLYYDDVLQTCNWPANLSDERKEACGLTV
jgi:chitinase